VSISAATVKELRDKTGCGFMDCKTALAENNGDIEAAVDFLRKKGIAAAAKKAHRATSEGLVEAYLASDGKLGALIEVNCETDFVARTDDFKNLVQNLVRQAAESGDPAAAVEAFLAQPYSADPSKTVEEAVNATVGKIGENMRLHRFERFACEGGGVVNAYIHPGNKIGVLLEVGCESDAVAASDDFKALVKDLAMQVAASAPICLVPEDVPAEVLAKEKEILLEQARESGKPENILDKIVEGRIKKYFDENCLLEQQFIKDTDRRVKEVVDAAAASMGEKIEVRRFQRFQLGS
jgi:elongation factor Ts